MRLLFSFFIILYSNIIFSQNIKTYIPEQAKSNAHIVKQEVNIYASDIYPKEYFPGLIEQESCIHLKHRKCWNQRSKLESHRELGIGVGQLTKAYREDGSIRFDSLTEIKRLHQKELKELSWSNIEERLDLQIRAMVLMTKDNYSRLYQITDELQRLKMADAAYNGGLGGVYKDQRLCSLTKGCKPSIWDRHVEVTCAKSKKPLYGNRNACDINREHVLLIFEERMNKYYPYMN